MTCRAIWVSTALLSATPLLTAAQAQSTAKPAAAPSKPTTDTAATDKAVAASKVRSVVHVQLVGNDIRYTIDADPDSIGNKLDGVLVTTSSPIKVTYPRLNPLRMQASASVSEVDDPSQAAIAKLIEAITGIPAIIKPGGSEGTTLSSKRFPESGPGACLAYKEAQKTLDAIRANLYGERVSAATLKSHFEGWKNAIDTAMASGPASAAIKAGADAIENDLQTLKTQLDNAATAITDVEKHLSDQSKIITKERAALNAFLAVIDAPAKGMRADIDKVRISRQADIAPLAKAADDADECARDTAMVYSLIRLTNPEARLAQLRKLEQTIKDLQATLKDRYGREHWLNETDYVLALDVMPNDRKMQRVTVKVVPIKIESADGTLSMVLEDAVSATFDVQLYTRFVPELGVGVTFGFVSRPKYGTGTDASGNTIVVRSKNEEVSFDPTVMVNFVPRGASGGIPIAQLGASVSKNAPAVLLGGGWRIPGSGEKGGLVVGVGLALAWVQDLHDLKEGSVVKGTSEIDADYKFGGQPKPRFYVNFQYKF